MRRVVAPRKARNTTGPTPTARRARLVNKSPVGDLDATLPGQLYLPSLLLIYAMSRRSILPSAFRQTLKRSLVVAIGVDRSSVDRDNGYRFCWLLSLTSSKIVQTSPVRSSRLLFVKRRCAKAPASLPRGS